MVLHKLLVMPLGGVECWFHRGWLLGEGTRLTMSWTVPNQMRNK